MSERTGSQGVLLAVEVMGEIEAACVRSGIRPDEWSATVMGVCPCGCGLRIALTAHARTMQVAQLRFRTAAGLREGLDEWLGRVARSAAAAAMAPAKPDCRHHRLH